MRVHLRPLSRGQFFWSIFAFVGAIALALLVEFPHGTQHWSARSLTNSLAWQPATQDARIAIVTITPTTLGPLPYESPIDRKLLADLVRTIDQAGPKAVAIDILFTRPTEPEKDQELLEALKAAKSKIVLGVGGAPHVVGREADFQAAFVAAARRPPGHAHFDVAGDSPFESKDGVVRRASVLYQPGMPAMSLAQTLADIDASAPPRRTTDYIYWPRPPKDGTHPFLELPAESLVGSRAVNRALLTAELKDRLVIVGGVFPDRDRHPTPLAQGERVPGVLIHAYILQQTLDGRRLRAWDQYPTLIFFVIGATVVGLAILLLDVDWPVGKTIVERWPWVTTPRRWIARLLAFHGAPEVVIVVIWLAITVLAFRYFDVVIPFAGVGIILFAALAARHTAHHDPQ